MTSHRITKTSLSAICDCLALVPEFDPCPTVEDLRARSDGHQSLALVAHVDGEITGCKFGYAIDSATFYSWVGGVIPAHRKSGIAAALLDHQERWAAEHGYQTVRVKSMNRYPGMIRLLIRHNYQIISTEGDDPNTLKIIFEKQL